MLIPVRTALLGADGQLISLVLNGTAVGTEVVLELSSASQVFVFTNVGAARPVVSVLRGFSAPVTCVVSDQTEADLTFILVWPLSGWCVARVVVLYGVWSRVEFGEGCSAGRGLWWGGV